MKIRRWAAYCKINDEPMIVRPRFTRRGAEIEAGWMYAALSQISFNGTVTHGPRI